MDSQDRFIKRLYLIEHLDLWLREAAYHRAHDELEDLPWKAMWKRDEDVAPLRLYEE